MPGVKNRISTHLRTLLWRPIPIRPLMYRLLALLLGIIAAVLIWYVLSCFYASRGLYDHFKIAQRGWRGGVHRADPVLGFSPIPNSKGFHTFPIGPDIAMKYDRDGFRVPVSQPEDLPRKRPLILALGCSFTYGDACKAEDTFVYLLGNRMSGSSMNAGVCSYGLTQMLLLSRTLIPKYRPDYVIVQFSPWLAQRSMSELAPSYYGLLAVPYFSEEPDGKIGITPPLFRTLIFDLPFDRYRTTATSSLDWLSFYMTCLVPLQIHDRICETLVRYKRLHHRIPTVAKDRERIRQFAYGEIAETCRRYGSTMAVVALGRRINPSERQWLVQLPGTILVDAQLALDRFVQQRHSSSAKLYGHWRGSPPLLLDEPHPNPLAHRIIAQEIAAALSNRK